MKWFASISLVLIVMSLSASDASEMLSQLKRFVPAAPTANKEE